MAFRSARQRKAMFAKLRRGEGVVRDVYATVGRAKKAGAQKSTIVKTLKETTKIIDDSGWREA